MRRILGWCVAIFLCALVGGTNSPAGGQEAASSLRGTVTDQTGGVLVGATMTLTNVATNVSHKTTTGGDGSYVFTLVPTGKYKLTVEHPGFRTYVQTGIVLELNQNARLDVALQLGQSSQTIEVRANLPQVDTTGAVLGKVEDERSIADLPLVGRDTLQLGLLQAGVFTLDPTDGSGNPFSVSGQRSESLTFLIDGADNNDFLGNNIVVSPNPDAVKEFKILTNNYDAQFGRTSGGIVNQVTKSGTNDFHGDVSEYFRNDKLNARDFFLPERTAFKRNIFGGALGGPVKKDKTFFFVDYQGSRRREGQVAPILTVLSPNERNGDFGELCSNNFDTSGNCLDPSGTQLFNPVSGAAYPFNKVPVNPVSQAYINKFLPPPNLSNNGFVAGPVAKLRDDQAVVHIDHMASAHDSLSFLYLLDDNDDQFPFQIINGASTGGDVPNGSGFLDSQRSQVGTATWTHTFARGWTNEFRFATNRVAQLQAVPTDHTPPSQLGFTNVNPDDPTGVAPPIIFTPSFNLGPSPQGPTKLHRATFQWQDNLIIPHGRHEWRFGVDVRRVRNNFVFDFFNNGSYDFGGFGVGPINGTFTGDPLADFVGGYPDNYFQFSKAIYALRTSSYYFYGQDTWKVLSRLSLNLGLRYEYNTPQTDPHREIMGFFPGRQSTVFPNAPPDILYPGDPNTGSQGMVFPDRNNFAPRIGFAWDLFGNARMVMRGGFGIFYDIEDGALNLQFGGQPPFGDATNLTPGPSNFAAGNVFADPFTPLGIQNPFPFKSVGTFFVPKMSFAFLTSPHFRTPYSENFNFGFQFQVTKNTMVEAVYVGSLGRKLISTAEVNFPDPAVEQQQLQQFGAINPECARPLAACTGGVSAIDPSGSPTGAQLLVTNLSNGLSDSHEFQLTIDKRFSHGFLLRTAYTLSKTIDVTSGFRARSAQFTDPLNFRFDRSPADFDTPQRLVISGVWETPFQKPFRNTPILRKIFEGWQFSGIATFQAGFPFSLFSDSGSSQQNSGLDRPDVLGPIQMFSPKSVHTFNLADANCLSGSGTSVTGNFLFDPRNIDCSNVLLFSFGNMGRNALRGPGINNFDLAFMKKTKITESRSLEFRLEAFNTFNHTQFLNPNSSGTAGFTNTFGQISQTRAPRLVQLALKFLF